MIYQHDSRDRDAMQFKCKPHNKKDHMTYRFCYNHQRKMLGLMKTGIIMF